MPAPSPQPRDGLPLLDPAVRSRFRRRLLQWFDAEQRDLPWRRSRDPYPIWISEVMLQQTQVAAVIPFFERFLQRFPDVASLAVAEEAEILRLWEGLGYYRRARNLHEAARQIAAHHGGVLPRDPEALRSLPGFGRYTANAVLSQAFDAPLPILEANSRRLLSRLVGIEADLQTKAAETELWSWAEQLLPKKRVGDFNQALMELGSLLCKPDAPQCGRCPAQAECYAFRHQAQDRIPARAKRVALTDVREVAVVVRKAGEVLLAKRPATGRWANMWEFPRAAVEGDAEQAAHDLLRRLGIAAELGAELTTIRHGVTRFRIRLSCLEATWKSGAFRCGEYVDGVWVRPDRLDEYPVSRPQRRLAEMAKAAPPSHLF